MDRRTLLKGFLAIPAVVFANRALPAAETRVLPWTTGLTVEPRSLWGQIMVGDTPWGEPFRMVAESGSKFGIATFKTPDTINLVDAPDSGQLRVSIWSADYGLLGTSDLNTVGGPVTEGCTVAVTSIVMGPA